MNISSVTIVPSSDTATDTMTDFEKVDRAHRSSADTCLFWLPSGAYTRSFWIGIFHTGNFRFWVSFLKQLLLRNCAMDFVEICNVYVGKMIIKAAKRIFNSDMICRSYSNLNFGVTFWEHSVVAGKNWNINICFWLSWKCVNCELRVSISRLRNPVDWETVQRSSDCCGFKLSRFSAVVD